MPKLKEVLPSIFNVGKETNQTTYKPEEGRLETDALPVSNEDQMNNGNNSSRQSIARMSSTPTASAELTESVVRELSDPNYNSMAVVESVTVPGTTENANNQELAVGASLGGVASTMNTMNVHSAQQQVVMNFSNASNLHFGSVYNFNQNLSANSARNSNCNADKTYRPAAVDSGGVSCGSTSKQTRHVPRKTVSIVAMMQSQNEPNHRLLDTVATHLGEGWKQVMRDLGHSEGQIEQAIIDHQVHGNIKEVIYQLLLQWLRNADDGEGTVGRLTTLLWKTDHHECVQRMKLVWKATGSQS